MQPKPQHIWIALDWNTADKFHLCSKFNEILEYECSVKEPISMRTDIWILQKVESGLVWFALDFHEKSVGTLWKHKVSFEEC